MKEKVRILRSEDRFNGRLRLFLAGGLSFLLMFTFLVILFPETKLGEDQVREDQEQKSAGTVDQFASNLAEDGSLPESPMAVESSDPFLSITPDLAAPENQPEAKTASAPRSLARPEIVGPFSQRWPASLASVPQNPWLMIDSQKGEAIPVELSMSSKSGRAASLGYRSLLQSKELQSKEAPVSLAETGFLVVRGLPGVVAGGFEVPEVPACATRYSMVVKEEICEIHGKNRILKLKFSPPAVDPVSGLPTVEFSSVALETEPQVWQQLISFNEGFFSVGDPNRDGWPDFSVESETETNGAGLQVLLLSSPSLNGIDYTAYDVSIRRTPSRR